MVGTNPMTDPVSTTIPVEIVPVRLVFSNAVQLDSTTAAITIPNTPLFVNGPYAEGSAQYGDALMRSQFWKFAAGTNYHVLLGKPLVEPTQQVMVPSTDGFTSSTNGRLHAYLKYAWFTGTIEPEIIQQLGIDPRTLAIVATLSTSLLEPNGACCYGGYHSALQMNTALGPSIVTTAWASVVPNGVESLSHEIGEWFDDPFYTNVVPQWVNPISDACNGDQLEVGDPVTIYTFLVNGSQVQDLVFFSWFSHDVPSLGINGKYDLMGRFTQPARSC